MRSPSPILNPHSPNVVSPSVRSIGGYFSPDATALVGPRLMCARSSANPVTADDRRHIVSIDALEQLYNGTGSC